MNYGYLLLITGLVAFGSLGIFHKVADHPECRPKMTAVLLNFWGFWLALGYTAAFDKVGLHFPRQVIIIGGYAGVIAGLALFVFQTALKYGKISTSWLIINLATAVPVLLAIVIYGEKPNLWKSLGVVLVFVAIVMMWADKKIDLKREDAANPGIKVKSKWLPLMMIAFVGQGLAASSQKIFDESKTTAFHPGDYVYQFLIILYLTGFLTVFLLSIMREKWPNRREWSTALVMAGCSVVGNAAITKAMTMVPASVAYPVSNGGSLSMVVIGGVIFFREKIHPVGIAGIVCGIGAILILVLT